MQWEITNSNQDVLVLTVEGGALKLVEVRPYVYRPSPAEINAKELAQFEEK